MSGAGIPIRNKEPVGAGFDALTMNLSQRYAQGHWETMTLRLNFTIPQIKFFFGSCLIPN